MGDLIKWFFWGIAKCVRKFDPKKIKIKHQKYN